MTVGTVRRPRERVGDRGPGRHLAVGPVPGSDGLSRYIEADIESVSLGQILVVSTAERKMEAWEI